MTMRTSALKTRLVQDQQKRARSDPLHAIAQWLVRARHEQTMQLDQATLMRLQDDLLSNRITQADLQGCVKQLVSERAKRQTAVLESTLRNFEILPSGLTHSDGVMPPKRWVRVHLCRRRVERKRQEDAQEHWVGYCSQHVANVEVMFRTCAFAGASRKLVTIFRYVAVFHAPASAELFLQSLVDTTSSLDDERRTFQEPLEGYLGLMHYNLKVAPGNAGVHARWNQVETSLYPTSAMMGHEAQIVALQRACRRWHAHKLEQENAEQRKQEERRARKRDKKKKKKKQKKDALLAREAREGDGRESDAREAAAVPNDTGEAAAVPNDTREAAVGKHDGFSESEMPGDAAVVDPGIGKNVDESVTEPSLADDLHQCMVPGGSAAIQTDSATAAIETHSAAQQPLPGPVHDADTNPGSQSASQNSPTPATSLPTQVDRPLVDTTRIPGAELLSHEMVEFSNMIGNILSKSNPSRQRILQQVFLALKSVLPCARLELYGSLAYGMALPSSDIDCYYVHRAGLPCSNTRGALNKHVGYSGVPGCMHHLPVPQQLEALRQYLWQQPWCSKVTLAKNAAIPVLRLNACPLAMDHHNSIAEDTLETSAQHMCAQCCTVDLSCGHSPSHTKSDGVQYVRNKMAEYPLLRPLLVVVKQYLQQAGLTDPFTGGIGTFPLIVLLIRYFQTWYFKPISPPPAGSSMYKHWVAAKPELARTCSFAGPGGMVGMGAGTNKNQGVRANHVQGYDKHLKQAPTGRSYGFSASTVNHQKNMNWVDHERVADAQLADSSQSASMMNAQPFDGQPNLETGASVDGLGEALVGVLDFYGNKFDPSKFGVSVRGNGVLYPIAPNFVSPLTVENPLLPSQNCASGTFNVAEVIQCFRNGHVALVRAMEEYDEWSAAAPAGSGCEQSILRRLLKTKWGERSRNLLKQQLR